MTIGQKIFYLLEEKNMTQREFSRRTGIATTSISDWRKKNTNPGSDKILAICAALDVTPEYLLSGVTEDSNRGHDIDYMVLPKGSEERELVELYGDMSFVDRAHLLEYAKRLNNLKDNSYTLSHKDSTMTKIAEFNDIEIYMDSEFNGVPSVDVNYIDDDVHGSIELATGKISGNFSKYVLPVLNEWFKEHKDLLVNMWETHHLDVVPEWR